MGDIIETHRVRAAGARRSAPMSLYFDTGASRTLMKQRSAARLGIPFTLPKPQPFRGFGNGHLLARGIFPIEIKLLGFWCPHVVYVVPDIALPVDEDLLIGHDFMQIYHIRLDPRRQAAMMNRASLQRGLLIR